MDRRTALRWAGAGVAAGLAGCLDGLGGDGVTPPPENRDTRSLLPDPPEGWSRTAVDDLSTNVLDIRQGNSADYSTPADDTYEAEVINWHTEDEAERGGDERYADWSAWVVSGTFTFAATGLDDELARRLLANALALTREYVDEHA
ncbi:MAG: hypothetical protein V5A23_05385 [Halobacteriales archaeon]